MNKILKIIVTFILVLAVCISLDNIANLRNNNVTLKTDNEILTEQLQGYADSLTITKAELIVAQNDRDKLKQDIVTCENKIAELNSQSVVDKEALALAENDLATTQQKLAEKESEIAKFNDTIEKYSIYPMISYHYNGNLKDNVFKPSYDIRTRTSTYISDKDSSEWIRTSTSGYSGNSFYTILYDGYKLSDNTTYYISFYTFLADIRNVFNEMLSAGIQVGSFDLYGKFPSSSFDKRWCTSYYTFYIADFLELTNDGIFSEEDFDYLFGNSKLSYSGDLTDFSVRDIRVYAYYSDETLDTSNFDFEVCDSSLGYYSGNLIFNEADFTPNKLFLGITDEIFFNNIYLNVKLDALVIAPIDHGKSYSVAFDTNDMIIFSDEFYVERLYLPNDVKEENLREDLKGKYGEIIYLDFSRYSLQRMSYPI